MKISCNKLKKHIKNSEDIDFLKIWDTFTIRTAEVEEVIEKGKDLTGVVIGKIVECENHPTKEKYHVLKVDNGHELHTVLCGAPNVKKGLVVPYIQVGGTIDGFTIAVKEIAKVMSEGMLCSGKELGISDNHEGILELPEDLAIGADFKSIYPVDDIIVEIDNKSLTNRPDLWGHYGIAREIAAITNHELLPLELSEVDSNLPKLDITVNDYEACPRYTGLKIENITNNKTPIDMQIFLYYAGMRSISLLVDLTNYIMLELGQPMHAFDARTVKQIEVGMGDKNTTYQTLDGTERKIDDKILMIKKNHEYFGIAGIMGGLDSEILEDTNSIVLESANFDATVIRKGSKQLGIRSEASARYEKSLDPNMTIIATKRFVQLLKENDASVKFGSCITDLYPNKLEEKEIKLSKDTLKTYLKEDISDKFIIDTLKALEFTVKVTDKEFIINVPTFRATKDISIEADIIEEIVRMYGYENVKKEPLKLALTFTNFEQTLETEYTLKNYLAIKHNYHEIHTYLWNKTSFLNKMRINLDNVKLLGKKEDNILRDDLGLSLLEAAYDNLKHLDTLKIMEIGTVVLDNTNRRFLSMLSVVNEEDLEKTYNEVKSTLAVIFKSYKHIDIEYRKNSLHSYYNDELSYGIFYNDVWLGNIKVLNGTTSSLICKKKAYVIGEIDFDKYMELDANKLEYKEISKYQSVSLDYTIVAKGDTKYSIIDNVINTFESEFINSIKLIDKFKTEKETKYTIRYELGSQEKTLTSEELEDFKNKFIEHVKKHDLSIVE